MEGDRSPWQPMTFVQGSRVSWLPGASVQCHEYLYSRECKVASLRIFKIKAWKLLLLAKDEYLPILVLPSFLYHREIPESRTQKKKLYHKCIASLSYGAIEPVTSCVLDAIGVS